MRNRKTTDIQHAPRRIVTSSDSLSLTVTTLLEKADARKVQYLREGGVLRKEER
jgi:hypothetical protein